MILERSIFNKVNIGQLSLLASSRRLLSGSTPADHWRLKSSYGWFLPVQTRSLKFEEKKSYKSEFEESLSKISHCHCA